ncbi:hypothetical protein [Mycolicibacterium tusciae]|uniref:hypothetical protein n=1 Tax=Mycolicibacterium tusciae TaxID=75922 RepID=UPI001EF8C02F|nr:hypothetical protein [Mycolicibacterium tusciae]
MTSSTATALFSRSITKANGAIRKAWVNERMGERVINGTSKQRKVLSYIRSGFIV